MQLLLAGVRRERSLLFGTLLSLFLVLHAASYNFISDDAFIALRYSTNLVHGEGLVFNPGERVEGYTSPLWVLLLAGAEAMRLDPVPSARILGVLFAVLTVLSTWRLASRCMSPTNSQAWALYAPLMLAANGSFACWAPAGLETSLFAFLVVSSCLAAVSGGRLGSAALAGLCTLARPEGVLVVAAIAAHELRAPRTSHRAWFSWLIIPLATLAALSAFRFVYYGDLLPNTFYAKTGATAAQWHRGLVYLSEYAGDHEGLVLLLIPTVVFLLRSETSLRTLSIGAILLWGAVVWVGGDGLPMYRFAVPALPLVFVLQAALLQRLWHSLVPTLDLGRRRCAVVGSVLVAGLVLIQLSPPAIGNHYSNYRYQRDVEVPRWSRVGLWLRENARPGDSIAAVPIGAVSYYSGLKTYDMVGLTDRHIAHRQMPEIGHGWAGHEKHDGPYILSRRPTYLLLGNIDVTEEPRDATRRPFIPYTNPWILARERDMFDGDLIDKLYHPRSVRIGPREHLNFYELNQEHRAGDE